MQDGLFVIRVLKEQTVLLQQKVDSLNVRISLLKENESDYQDKAKNLQTQVDFLQVQKANHEQQITMLESAYKEALKNYKRQKRKTVFVGIAGALVSAVLILKPF